MQTNLYPNRSGFKRNDASEINARNIDRDPERKLQAYLMIAWIAACDPTHNADEIAEEISEPILYVRPRVSELVSLGLIQKGPRRKSKTHGKLAHNMIPSVKLRMAVITGRKDDDAILRKIRALILAAQDQASAGRISR